MRVRVVVLSVLLSTPSFMQADENPIDAGIAAAWRGDSAAAEAALRVGVAACAEPSKPLPADAPRCASGMNVLAALLHADGREREAETLFRRAISSLDGGAREHAGLVADASNGLAGVFVDRRRWREAERFASRARELWEKSSGRDCPDLARALMTLAEIRLAAGDIRETERLLRRAGRLAERPGASPVLQTAVQARRGLLWLALGRYADAEPALEGALERAEDLAGLEHPALVRMVQVLADCYRLRNRLSDAAGSYERALRIAERTHGGSHPILLPALAGLADVAERQGDDARALALHTRALTVVDKNLVSGDPRRLQYLCRLAGFHARRRDPERAEILFQEVVDALDGRHDGALHAAALEGLRGVYLAMGRRADAARLERRGPSMNVAHRDEPGPLAVAAFTDPWMSATEP